MSRELEIIQGATTIALDQSTDPTKTIYRLKVVTAELAGAPGTDSFGDTYRTGDKILTLENGLTKVAIKKPDIVALTAIESVATVAALPVTPTKVWYHVNSNRLDYEYRNSAYITDGISYVSTDAEWEAMEEMIDGQIVYHSGRGASYIYDTASQSWAWREGANSKESFEIVCSDIQREFHGLDDRAGREYGRVVDGTIRVADHSRHGDPRAFRPGACLTLNGTSEYLPLGTFVAPEDMTIAFKFRAAATPSAQSRGLVGQWQGTGDEKSFLVEMTTSGHLIAHKSTDGAFSAHTTLSTNYADGAWHDVVVRYDHTSGNPEVFIDGVKPAHALNGSDTGQCFTSPAPLEIGRYNEDNIRCFPGSVQDVRIYNRLLTDAEIAAIAAMTPGSPEVGPTDARRWYQFHEGVGLNVFNNGQDAGGHGVVVGDAATIWASTANTVYSFPNEIGHSLMTRVGSGTSLSAPRKTVGALANLSVSVDVIFESTTTDQVIVAEDGAEPVWQLSMLSSGHLRFEALDGSGWTATTFFTFPKGVLHNIVFVKTASSINAYVNGAPAAFSASVNGAGTEAGTDNKFYIGRNLAGNPAKALIGRILIEEVAWDAGTRSDLYYDGIIPPNAIHINRGVDLKTGLALTPESTHVTAALPRDETNPQLDAVLGESLQFKGQCPRDFVLQAPSLKFDGTNNYAFIPYSLTGVSDYEISFKFQTAASADQVLFDNRDADNTGVLIRTNADGTIEAQHNAVDATTVGTYDDNEWHDVRVAWDGATLTLTVDTETVSAAVATPLAVLAESLFGHSGVAGLDRFNGKWVDLQIVANGVLQASYPCVGYEGILWDISGQNRDGTIEGISYVTPPVFPAPPPIPSVWTSNQQSVFDNVLGPGYVIATQFDGSSYYESADDAIGDNLGSTPEFSFGAWVYGGGVNEGVFTISSAWPASTSSDFRLLVSSGYVHYRFMNETFNQSYALPTGWQHVSVVVDGTDVILYLNGEEVKRTAWGAEIDFQNGKVVIGAYHTPASAFTGYLAGILFEGKAWDAETVQKIYTTADPKKVKELRPAAWYFPYADATETNQGYAGMAAVGDPVQTIVPAGRVAANSVGKLAPRVILDMACGEPNSPTAVKLLASPISNLTYTQGDGPETNSLFVRDTEYGDDRLQVFGAALSGIELSKLNYDVS